MKVSFKKILGVATLALAACFMGASCDNGNSAAQTNFDDELANDPATDIQWEFSDEGTVTRVAIELDQDIIGEKGTAITSWESIKFYGWAQKAGLTETKPLGDWGGTTAVQLSEGSNIYYVNIPAAKTPRTESINLIVNTGDDDQISIGSIRSGESKIFKLVEKEVEVEAEDGTKTTETKKVAELVDWDGEGAAAEGEEPVVTGKLIVGVTANFPGIAGWTEVFAYAYGTGEEQVFGGWPGTALTKDETLGIWILEKDEVAGNEWTIIFNNNANDTKTAEEKAQFTAGNILNNKIKLYARADQWIDWDGISQDTTVLAGPTGSSSTIIAVDLTLSEARMSNWSKVYLYSYNKELFKGWPGIAFTKSESDSNIWYADVTGKEGTGIFIFNNNSGTQLGDVGPVTIEEGGKYIFRNGAIVEWDNFSVDVLNVAEVSEPNEPPAQNTESKTSEGETTQPAEGETTGSETTQPSEGATTGSETTQPAEGDTTGSETTQPAEGETSGSETTQPVEGETTEPETIPVPNGKYTIGVTADYYKLSKAEKIYVWYWGDHNSTSVEGNAYPGEEFTLNEELGIWVKEIEVVGEEGNSITAKINLGGDDALYQGTISFNQTKLLTHAGTWIDWDGISEDTTEAFIPTAITAESTILAIDASKVEARFTKWGKKAVYAVSEDGTVKFFGNTPGLLLTQSESNTNIFYVDISGMEGTMDIEFNNTNSAKLTKATNVTIEAGKKYIYAATEEDLTLGTITEWDDFSLDVINADDKE